jgi:dihydrofolate reductase
MGEISMIAAIGPNKELGKGNKLVHNIPEDMRRFVSLTKGKTVVMGRKTYESIGKPLKNRTNIILSKNTDLEVEGCTVMTSVEDILALESDLFIIGGAQVYKEFLSHADRLYMTFIAKGYDADAYFPTIGQEWELDGLEDYRFDRDGFTCHVFANYKRKVEQKNKEDEN